MMSQFEYSMSDILQKVNDENKAIVKQNFFLPMSFFIEKDPDKANRVRLTLRYLHNRWMLLFILIIAISLVFFFILFPNGGTIDSHSGLIFTILCVSAFCIWIIAYIVHIIRRKYCFIDSETVTIFTGTKPIIPKKNAITFPSSSCKICLSLNVIYRYSLFFEVNGKKHVLNSALPYRDAHRFIEMME